MHLYIDNLLNESLLHVSRRLLILILPAVLANLFSLSVEAYPDLIRHNYTNCTSCHVSPTGGGLLNAYGRAMSKEIVSTWGREREEEFLHGYLPKGMIPEGLQMGGDLRIIQVHKETETKKIGRAFLMQSNIEIGAQVKNVTGVIAVGYADPKKRKITPDSPKFYLIAYPFGELSVRAGRFTPVFGIGIPYHTLPTRQGLGFGTQAERDTVETIWSGEKWTWGASLSRRKSEKMLTLQLNRNFLDSHRIGASILMSEADSRESRRDALSIHGQFGINHRWAYLTEFALQKAGAGSSGLYHFSQLLFEVVQGLNLYFMEDYQKSDLTDDSTIEYSLGPGLRFNPRPHYEIDGYFSKKRVASQGDRWDDSAWLVLHYYF